MSLSKNNLRKRNNAYYQKVLLQYLGLEKEIFVHTDHSCKFYHQDRIYILWFGANKLQEAKSGNWINSADRFIIEKVLKEKSAPYLANFQPK